MAGVQNDVCALRYRVAIYDVVRQGPAHGEVHHRVEPQAFVDEALQIKMTMNLILCKTKEGLSFLKMVPHQLKNLLIVWDWDFYHRIWIFVAIYFWRGFFVIKVHVPWQLLTLPVNCLRHLAGVSKTCLPLSCHSSEPANGGCSM